MIEYDTYETAITDARKLLRYACMFDKSKGGIVILKNVKSGKYSLWLDGDLSNAPKGSAIAGCVHEHYEEREETPPIPIT